VRLEVCEPSFRPRPSHPFLLGQPPGGIVGRKGEFRLDLVAGRAREQQPAGKENGGSVVAEPQFPKEERQPASPCADVLPRSPISGIVGCCARAPSGHITVALPRSVMNSRRPHWLPSSRGLHPTTSLSESCVVHNSKIGSQWQLWLKAGPRGAVATRPLSCRKRSSFGRRDRSGMCQQRNHALQQNSEPLNTVEAVIVVAQAFLHS
jgi:hypothetical protein